MCFQSHLLRLLTFIGMVSMTGCLMAAHVAPADPSTSGDRAAPTSTMTLTALPEKTSTPTATPTSTLIPAPTLTATMKSPGQGNVKPPAAAVTLAPSSTPVPAAPATAVPPTIPPASQLTPVGMSSGQSVSPDGKYTAAADVTRVVITAQDGRVAYIYRTKWFRFVGWTADSRYAVMNYSDQYGNQGALGFDTTQWKEFWISPAACSWQMNSHCQQGAVGIIPDGPSVLLSDGTVVNLKTIPASSADCIAPFFFLFPVACADEVPVMAQASQQVFEGGRMVWVRNGPYYAASEIYVLLTNGDAEIFRDTWTSAEPASDPGIVPPSGKYQPAMGFGKVWRSGTLGSGQTVREALGWAVAPDQGYSSLYQRATSSSSKSLYLFAADRQVINLFWPQSGTHTRWETVAP